MKEFLLDGKVVQPSDSQSIATLNGKKVHVDSSHLKKLDGGYYSYQPSGEAPKILHKNDLKTEYRIGEKWIPEEKLTPVLSTAERVSNLRMAHALEFKEDGKDVSTKGRLSNSPKDKEAKAWEAMTKALVELNSNKNREMLANNQKVMMDSLVETMQKGMNIFELRQMPDYNLQWEDLHTEESREPRKRKKK